LCAPSGLSRTANRVIREHVRRQVDVLSAGERFVFQQIHNIMANVPLANIVAMFDALRD
jgi:uroporphyrinogen-III decarboxylase